MKWFYGADGRRLLAQQARTASTCATSASPTSSIADAPAGHQHREVQPRAARRERLGDAAASTQPRRLLYAGRVSVEKNLPMLVEAFKQALRACAATPPWSSPATGRTCAEMKRELAGLPAYFLGYQNDAPARPALRRQRSVRLPLAHRHARPGRDGSAGLRPARARQQRGRPEGNRRRRRRAAWSCPANDPARWCERDRRAARRRAAPPAHGRAAAASGRRGSRWRATFERFWADHVDAVDDRRDEATRRRRTPSPGDAVASGCDGCRSG